MKIGVLTLNLHNNFGGIIQAYALQKVLREMGHNVVLIDKSKYVSVGPWYKKYPIYIKRAIQKYLLPQGYELLPIEQKGNPIDLIASNEPKKVAIKLISENDGLSNDDIYAALYDFIRTAKIEGCTNLLIAVDSERLLSLTEVDDKYITPLTLEWMQVK